MSEEVILRGLPISKGIGIGYPVFYIGREEKIPEVAISPKEIDTEIDRYRKALALSRQDVETLQRLSLQGGASEVVSILGAHLEMLQDPLLTHVIEERIRDTRRNTESIVHHVIEEYKERFFTLKDRYFQERVRDIVDVSRRILGHLRPLDGVKMGEVAHNSVIFTHELVPSETVEANASSVSAFVTAAGGITSHAAIIARAKGIPYVANIDIQQLKKIEIHSLIVDGSQGLVILNPTFATLKKYQQIQHTQKIQDRRLANISHLKGETLDGYEVRILANLENPKEIPQLLKAGACGVGLFRSEYLIFSRKAFPSEEEQFVIYKKMAKAMKGRPLVIRVFDIGGDKQADLDPTSPDLAYFTAIGFEPNPALGCRAIRFLLRYPNLLQAQLRAICRASVYGDIHILIPMVSDIEELHIVRTYLKDIQKELSKQRIAYAAHIPIGGMIEVPSSAIMAEVLAEEADFLSIGTNDLVQYVLATARTNSYTSHFDHATHPSILRLIQNIVTAARFARKPVILCGECAADPAMIPLLLGLGIREISVAARHIPLVKDTIRKWHILEACRLVEGALAHSSARGLKEYLASELRK